MTAEACLMDQAMDCHPPAAFDDESIWCNHLWHSVVPVMSVLVPSYCDDPLPLISVLNDCKRSNQIELIIYDDGSGDTDQLEKIKSAMGGFAGAACLVSAEVNKGRSHGRNRLETLARAEWMAFLDADMLPDDPAFLSVYADEIQRSSGPAMIVGGFSLNQVSATTETALHYAQCVASECITASERQNDPGRYVFSSNVLVHKDVMKQSPFDAAFSGWGWEDVDWGLRAAERFPIRHIDNTATHLGLDTPEALLGKYERSGRNFKLLIRRHPDAMSETKLYKMAQLLSGLPGKAMIRAISRYICQSSSLPVPLKLRLFALKLFRAAVYAEALNGDH